MAEILEAFRPGRNAWLTSLFLGRRVEKILFAATKADHLHHSQHPQLTAIVSAMLRDAVDRADFAGAETAAMSVLNPVIADRSTPASWAAGLNSIRPIAVERSAAAETSADTSAETSARTVAATVA